MKQILIDGHIYNQLEYDSEEEFEMDVVSVKEKVFGHDGIYLNIKKNVGKNMLAGRPDGYYLDLKYHETPTLYIVELELQGHDLYRHIAEQMFRFTTNMTIDSEKIKVRDILIRELSKDIYKDALETFYANSNFKNLHSLLDQAVLKTQIKAIVVIDHKEPSLRAVLKNITTPIETLEFTTYTDGTKKIHFYDKFEGELEEDEAPSPNQRKRKSYQQNIDYDLLDTIIVPAREEGFKKVFIGENCWYAIKILESRTDKIKYIVSYLRKPTSAITHIAEVDRIERYYDPITHEDSEKYKVIFKGPARKLEHQIPLPPDKPNLAPQSPRYTTYEKVMNAKTLSDLFGND